MAVLETRLHVAATACIAGTLVLLGTTEPRAEEARDEPLVGVHLQPNLSVLLPTGAGRTVTDVYGLIHPTGAVGLSIHLVPRFHLTADLEGHGWTGELPAVEAPAEGEASVEAVQLRFLTYWLHLRGRITVVRSGRFQLLADLTTGVLFGRESGERFRAEGRGVSVGVGPVAWLDIGRYFALSFSVLLESGWVWYDIVSPQSRGERYSLVWPRVVIGIGLHALLVHRNRAARRSRDEGSRGAPGVGDDEPSRADAAARRSTEDAPAAGDDAPAANEIAPGGGAPEAGDEEQLEAPWE